MLCPALILAFIWKSHLQRTDILDEKNYVCNVGGKEINEYAQYYLCI